ncbi:hypothetical protein [Candidatus Cyanaurora vandensis]|uniref:hypothetical protein n=1 Tax=Candidatus Cyanaurora vandensis TaxID=2714958 RepID=UPI00257AE030|nr:hypothetical protein [Candidatus Cyanaurora vandensis]
MRQVWDKILMLNLLFLAASFLWFVVLVLGQYLFRTDWGWVTFYRAWTWVINPSLGIFFVGVLVSFIQSKLPRSTP